MRLTEDVYLVGSGDYGFNLTHALDCHVYVVDSGEELAVVDAGLGLGQEQILSRMRSDGLQPSRVSRVIVTHYHADHVGGAAGLVRALGANLWAPAEAADAIRTADAERSGLRWAQTLGFYPADYVWQPCEVAHEFRDGDRFAIGELEMEAIACPGHCDGHYVLRLQGRRRTYLFSGDLVFWGGQIALLNTPDANMQSYAESLNRAAALEFDGLLPGHQMVSLHRGWRHVSAAAAVFNGMGRPDDLMQ